MYVCLIECNIVMLYPTVIYQKNMFYKPSMELLIINVVSPSHYCVLLVRITCTGYVYQLSKKKNSYDSPKIKDK